MRGLAGIIGRGDKKEMEFLMDQMIACMVHENFYGKGSQFDERLDFIAGWTYFRDVITRPVPIWNEKKDIYIIICGQIFVPLDTVQWLKDRGHCFLNKDHDYLVHLYEEWENGFFEKLNGQFAGLLADIRRKVLYLFNDRFGFGRIYYREIGGILFFSTEAKSLLRIFPDSRKLDPLGLSEFLTCSCTLRNHCLYEKISIMPPGSLWTFKPGLDRKEERYLKREEGEESRYGNKEDYYQRLKLTFRNILPRYFHQDKLVGMSITGGKDTRILLALADLSKVKLICYTFGSSYRENRDEKLGKLIAKYLQLPFYVIRVDNEFFKLFPQLAEKTVYVTDGTMDVSGAPGLYTNRIARNISPIRITGNYGQEILEKSVAFKPHLICERFVDADFIPLLRESYNAYSEEKEKCDKFSFIMMKQLPWHHYGRYKLESSQVLIYSPFLDLDILREASVSPLRNGRSSNDLRMRLYAEESNKLGSLYTDRGYKYGPLSLFDRFNIFLQEFTFKAEYAYDYGMPRWLSVIDYVLKPLHLEKIFLGRHKFYHFRIWYRDLFAKYIKEILLDRKAMSRDFINSIAVKRIISDHTKGISNHTLEIHKLLTIELIYRKLFEQWH